MTLSFNWSTIPTCIVVIDRITFKGKGSLETYTYIAISYRTQRIAHFRALWCLTWGTETPVLEFEDLPSGMLSRADLVDANSQFSQLSSKLKLSGDDLIVQSSWVCYPGWWHSWHRFCHWHLVLPCWMQLPEKQGSQGHCAAFLKSSIWYLICLVTGSFSNLVVIR